MTFPASDVPPPIQAIEEGDFDLVSGVYAVRGANQFEIPRKQAFAGGSGLASCCIRIIMHDGVPTRAKGIGRVFRVSRVVLFYGITAVDFATFLVVQRWAFALSR